MLFNKTFVSKFAMLRHDMMYTNMAKKSGEQEFHSKSSLEHISLVIKTKDVNYVLNIKFCLPNRSICFLWLTKKSGSDVRPGPEIGPELIPKFAKT